MLKKLYFFSALFFCFFLFAQSTQINRGDKSNIVCKYYVEFLKDTADVTTKKNEIMSLLIGEISSLYRSDQKRVSDSLKANEWNKSMTNVSPGNQMTVDFTKIPKSNIFHEVYKRNNVVRIYDRVLRDVFVFEPRISLEWNIIGSEKKIINGYNCIKATTHYNGRDYVAWFTNDIPIPEGPYVFKGLPGLIIELYDTNKYYYFILKHLTKSSEAIMPLKNAIESTYIQFYNTRKNKRENPVSSINQFLNIPLDKSTEEKIRKNNLKNNNFLD